MSRTLSPATVSTPVSPLSTLVLQRIGSSVLTSLGMLSQLGARAEESAWIEPATWVCVTSRNCARQGRISADLSARGHRHGDYDDAVISMIRLPARRTPVGGGLG